MSRAAIALALKKAAKTEDPEHQNSFGSHAGNFLSSNHRAQKNRTEHFTKNEVIYVTLKTFIQFDLITLT